MYFFTTLLFGLHEQDSSWVHIIGSISYPIQLIISLFLIDCYISNKEFRNKPGSIILFYALSALGISIIGGIEHYSPKDICDEVVGFIALFFEYNCLYYEIGFIFFFIDDFAELINDKFEIPGEAISPVSSPDNSFQIDDDPEPNIDPQRQAQEEAPNAFPQLEEKFLNLEEICKELQEQETQNSKNQLILQQKLNETNALFKETQRANAKFSRAFLQTKINVTAIIMSLASALIPYLTKNLGPNIFGGCSDLYKPEVQEIRMDFYLILAAINAIISALGLISFINQRKKLKKNTIEPLMNDPDLRKRMKEAKKYLRHVFLFIIVTTLCCWIFSGLNVYADLSVPISDENMNFTEWNDRNWDMLLFLHFIQGAVTLAFKLTEPMVWDAIKITYQNRWKKLKIFVKKYCCCCFRRERRSEGQSDLLL